MGLQNINSWMWTGNISMLFMRYWPLVFTHIQICPLFVQLTPQIPHMVQQIMSGKSMPVLLGAVPSFKIFMTQWEKLHTIYLKLKPWVNIGLEWAKKYYNCMNNTDMYVVVMCELLLSSLSNLNVNWQQIYCSQSSILASISSGSLAIGNEVILGVPKP